MKSASGAWAEYERWNDAVIRVMFPELEVPEPVFLDFEEAELEQLAVVMGVEADEVEQALASSVAATLTHAGPASIFARHMDRARAWARRGRTEDPPFVALLAVFCIAAEQMQAGNGMAASNYFGRLRPLLGWDQHDTRLDTAYRRVAERLWGELNRWLLQLDGQRGLPTAFALTYRYVGLTMSQALVRSADREHLREFFRQYGFAPGAEVPPSELEHLLGDWIAQRPCPVSSTLERLWKQSATRPRIAQAAAVTLAGWDGQVRQRGDGEQRAPYRGHLALTLEVGTFPRRRLAVQPLAYLSEPTRPRDAVVLSASPEVTVELVPDLPGALGLGRGSALHSSDVLEGLLRLRDSLTGQEVERRPRRLVLFREDELSKRWIESPQVMLGENVRVLVHEGISDRLEKVLAEVARPGWERTEPFPGQPEGWLLYDRVEVFNHPGALIRAEGMDDLAPLVPLTSSQLKVAGGFALPGRVRGKWHTWAPPEIRAISDLPEGFVVRVFDLNRFDEPDEEVDEAQETLLEEWSDEGSGVVVRSMADLELEDGDYRVEIVPSGEDAPISTTTVLLRSADTPDTRHWALLEGVHYSDGAGAIGLVSSSDELRVNGHVVEPRRELPPPSGTTDIRSAPWWSVAKSSVKVVDPVRLTRPDPTSCIYTGRHVQLIDTVPTDSKGKPLVAWVSGRCKGCGLERRFPTRLKRSSFGGRQPHVDSESPPVHDLSNVESAEPQEKDWATAFDALLHTGGGTWGHLERIAFQLEASALFLDHFARALEALGHIDVRRDPKTLEPVAWEVSPTSLAGTEDGYLFSGYWPGGLYAATGAQIEGVGGGLEVANAENGPASYFATCGSELMHKVGDTDFPDIPVIDVAWRDLAGALPPLSEVMAGLPRQSDALTGDITWYQPRDNAWVKSSDLAAVGAYRVRRFTTTDVVRTSEDLASGTVARATVQLGKHLTALLNGMVLMAYNPTTRELFVPMGADLPGLYGRAAVAASGELPVPVPAQRALRYSQVPRELADHLHDLFRT